MRDSSKGSVCCRGDRNWYEKELSEMAAPFWLLRIGASSEENGSKACLNCHSAGIASIDRICFIYW